MNNQKPLDFLLRLNYFFLSFPFVTRVERKDDAAIYVHLHPSDLSYFLLYVRDHEQLNFKSLLDLYAIDNFDSSHRYTLHYHLYSYTLELKIVVSVLLGDKEPATSVVQAYPSALWMEREVWDLFGIVFYGNPDLRRILTDYGFEGHPLLKDFPLSGYAELRYDDGCKRVVYEPLEVSQEYRFFSFNSPWKKL